MAGAYLLTLDKTLSGGTYKDGVDAVVVWAEDAATAIDVAQSQQSGTGASNDGWAAATSAALAATADYEGWRLRITATGGSAADVDVTITGTPADAMDDIGDLAVIALNALYITGSAYATPALTISAIGDGNGDATVTVTLYPPLADTDFPVNTLAFTSYIGAIVHEGIAGAALTVQLEPTFPVPTLLAKLKQ